MAAEQLPDAGPAGGALIAACLACQLAAESICSCLGTAGATQHAEFALELAMD
jgi:hypothetical protein